MSKIIAGEAREDYQRWQQPDVGGGASARPAATPMMTAAQLEKIQQQAYEEGLALGKREGFSRYGEATIPMEESLAQAVVDLAVRPCFRFEGTFPRERVGAFDLELVPEFLKAFAMNGRFTLHVRLFYGENAHHMAEAVFKALAYALRRAIGPAEGGPRSTKGVL